MPIKRVLRGTPICPECPLKNLAACDDYMWLARTQVIASVAVEELSLSHILNAQGESIQSIVEGAEEGGEESFCDMLRINRSVRDMLREIARVETHLKQKAGVAMEIVEPDCTAFFCKRMNAVCPFRSARQKTGDANAPHRVT